MPSVEERNNELTRALISKINRLTDEWSAALEDHLRLVSVVRHQFGDVRRTEAERLFYQIKALAEWGEETGLLPKGWYQKYRGKDASLMEE